MTCPGLVIAAPASGTGKTTVMLGLLRALRDDGVAVQPFKCGPDYIDPAFHRIACGRESYNLDSWAMPGALLDTLANVDDQATLALAEGSMGLFDGVAARGATGHGASADITMRMGWPVVLVIDVSGQAQSAAATAFGFAGFDPAVPVAGVILNRVASPRHERLVRRGMEAAGLRVFGSLPRRPDLTLPERHLGLVQATEHPALDAHIDACAALIRMHVDLAALREAAAVTAVRPTGLATAAPPPAQRIALARDAAFSFTYPHLVRDWHRAGAEIRPFSPLADEAPDEDAEMVWLPGGYPELHAGRLAAADRFRDGLHRHVARGGAVHGECGGYMALGEALVDAHGVSHRMAGLLGLVTSHQQRRMHLGYRSAVLAHPVGAIPADTVLTGHEFHYCTIQAQPDAPLAIVTDAEGAVVPETGSRRGAVTGSFFHLIRAEA